jgi:hypothetical protein
MAEKHLKSIINFEEEEDEQPDYPQELKIKIWDLARKRKWIDPQDPKGTNKKAKDYFAAKRAKGTRFNKNTSREENLSKALERRSVQEFFKESSETRTRKDKKTGATITYSRTKPRKYTPGETKSLMELNQLHKGDMKKISRDYNKKWGVRSTAALNAKIKDFNKSRSNKTKTSKVMETKKTPQKKAAAKPAAPKQKLSFKERKKISRANRKTKKPQ